MVNLTWGGVVNESGDKVYRSIDNVSFALIGTTAADVVSYGDTTVSGGTTYYYLVKAFNAVGDSALNITVSNLELADWKPFIGSIAQAGSVNATVKLLSQQAGKQLFDALEFPVPAILGNSGGSGRRSSTAEPAQHWIKSLQL